jgi:hypothetical protein
MNPSHHGSDEQVFGAKQQVLGTGPSDEDTEPQMNGIAIKNVPNVRENSALGVRSRKDHW